MVQHIRASVEQARGFISALLAHSVSRDQALRVRADLPAQPGQAHRRARATARATAARSSPATSLDVWADRVLLRQVLDNLIGNALKYVAPGVVPAS